jgi:undecaprenyl-phosphate 4-deoxy-4-formamido-L-arabinose transferase
MSIVDYSIVIPVYQCAENLDRLNRTLHEWCEGKFRYEIIYVDDYSSDNSWQVLKEIKSRSANTKIIRLSRNFGQHAATVCGFKHAAGAFVITMDDDLEVHPSQIPALIEEQKKTGSDITYGVYPKLNQPFIKGILTFFYKLASRVEGPKKGQGSSFRLIRKKIADELVSNHRHFIFIDEICLWYTNKLAFVNVTANPEYSRNQRYGIGGLMKMASTLIMFSSTFPLKLVTRIGLLLSSINFIIGSIYLVRKIAFKIHVEGYTSLIVSILFSTGLIILCLGIIAQYISHVLKGVHNAPAFHEDEVIC